jgi:hypothetical protein
MRNPSQKKPFSDAEIQRLRKLHAMLDTEFDGEATNAHNAIRKILSDHGCSWIDLPELIALTDPKTANKEAMRKTSDRILELFHDRRGDTWACVTIENPRPHREVYRIKSDAMRRYIRQYCFELGKTLFGLPIILTDKDLKAQVDEYDARADFEGAEHEVHLRVGRNAGTYYIDLSNPVGQAVKATADDWVIVDEPSIYFRRGTKAQPLPMPQRGGNTDELGRFLNTSDASFTLAKGFILAALRGLPPFPVLNPIGAAGQTKTTFQNVVRSFIDPYDPMISGAPTRSDDLLVAAQHAYCQSWDNLSQLGRKFSDVMCGLATGMGVMQREFYTRGELSSFPKIARPQMINGVAEFITQPDLMDRTMGIELLELETFIPEESFWTEFRSAAPRIFAGFLDLLVIGLRNLPKVKLSPAGQKLRMADFVTFGVACLGQDFERLYIENRAITNQDLLQENALAQAIKLLVDTGGSFQGAIKDLIQRLRDLGYEPEIDQSKTLSSELKRLKPALFTGYGIKVLYLPRKNNVRPIKIFKPETPPPDTDKPADAPTPEPPKTADTMVAGLPTPKVRPRRADFRREQEQSVLSPPKPENTGQAKDDGTDSAR